MNDTFQRRRALFCCTCRISELDSPQGRLLRCSRCKLTQYCSPKCQKQHFVGHKRQCQQIHRLETEVDALSSTILLLPRNSQHFSEQLELYSKLKTDLAKTTFIAAYHSCDTMERGASMMEISLQHYLRLVSFLAFLDPQLLVEIQHPVALLLCALDYDIEAYSFISFCVTNGIGSMESSNASSSMEAKVEYVRQEMNQKKAWTISPEDHTATLLSNNRIVKEKLDQVFLLILFIIKMKLIFTMRQDRTSLAVTLREDGIQANSEHTIRDMETTQECHLVELINHINPDVLIHVRDCVPLDALSEFHELTLLLQDCFFLTPGVRSIFDEYIDDDHEIYMNFEDNDNNPTNLID